MPLQVIGYQSRPVLRISPPQGSSDRRVKVYSFIEAINSLPTNFTPEEYRLIMSKVNPKLYNKLRETFVVLNDDLDRVNSTSRSASAQAGPGSGSNLTALGSGRGSKRPPEGGSSHRSQWPRIESSASES